MVSLVMLTHNAPGYVAEAIDTLQKTKYSDFELIVFDNASEFKTRRLLNREFRRGRIDKLVFSRKNLLFAPGNNMGARLCSKESQYIVLINSDIAVRDPLWLDNMLKVHQRGATGLGYCKEEPRRADGFCFLIDADLFQQYQLDENFEWHWAITKLEACLLQNGHTVTAVVNYENQVYHYGGGSGTDWKAAKGMDICIADIADWFEEHHVRTVERLG